MAAVAAWIALRFAPANVDVSWLLVACGRLLDGARLHVDIIEVNPPFSIWLYMPFVVAERATGIAAETWLALGLPAFGVLSVWCSARILGEPFADQRYSGWLAPAALAVLLCLSPGDFGQREQFATIALLPWLALQERRAGAADFDAGSTWQRVLAGLGVAVFVMIKPPLAVLAPALPTLYLCLRRRSLRPALTTETMLGAAITIAYLAYLAAVHLPFFVDLMPMLRDVYLPARLPLSDIGLVRPVVILLLLGLVTWAMSRGSTPDRGAVLLFLAAIGYVPAFLVMGKGWSYQALPFGMLGLLAFLLQVSTLRFREARPITLAAAAAGLALLIPLADPGHWRGLAERRTEIAQAQAAIGVHETGPTVVSIATRLQAAHPLTRAVKGRYLSRTPGLWMVDNAQALIDGGASSARLTALRDRFIDDAAAEIVRSRPDIVLAGGTRVSAGQAVVDGSAAVQRALVDYLVIHRDTTVTVYRRRDLTAPTGS